MLEHSLAICKDLGLAGERRLKVVEVALFAVGSVPAAAAYLKRADCSPGDVRLAFTPIAPSILPSADILCDMPVPIAERLLDLANEIGRIVGDWSVGVYGDPPSESDLGEISQTMQFASRGALLARLFAGRPQSVFQKVASEDREPAIAS